MKRLLKRVGISLLLLVIGLLAPIGYIELACKPGHGASDYAAILPPDQRRPEGRTLLTYPEWHIVHAYDDYAKVISTGDPHDYKYWPAIGGFWTSLCSLSKASGPHGGFPAEFKSTVYTIGVSFTAELLAKALYEETIGRVATLIRGETRAPLDDLTAQQAAQYAQFLRQVPWYQWDFRQNASAITDRATDAFRDRERRLAIGLEYKAKAVYAKAIAAAVANMEPDALRLRMIVTGLSAADLTAFDDVDVIATLPEGIEIEAPRYRALTELLLQWAKAGGDFVEIAGNDDILFTVTSEVLHLDEALYSFGRQGYSDTRHLILLPVPELAEALRGLDERDLTLEHIHDY
ncbi:MULTISPECIES: hypothetical protein [Roseobacteraceae]|uniref:Uncharacterized protein n=1 Tax=Pseudosulfitobacter pseudonitzschiae TaxID=1402135 RepID=A0A221K1W5_9RHOB|nr:MULTISPECIES: hypothetical protein [Roseobacteraceae]ASM72880.1 hypothetical protein SULPSESMR1_02077 [Pseudosulfitobacter pseudonitzschiae]